MSRRRVEQGRGVLMHVLASAALAVGLLGASPAMAEVDAGDGAVALVDGIVPDESQGAALDEVSAEEVPADLLQAVQDDLGMSWAEYVRVGARVEASAAILEEAPEDRVAVLTQEGVGLRSAQTLGGNGGAMSPFTDLDAVREAYLRDVGPAGLTGVAITLDGFEIMVADPDETLERGATGATASTVSPAQWGQEHGVKVTATSGEPQPAATLRGGTPIAFNGIGCSHGFNGWYEGKTRGIAVGHCVTMGGTRVTMGNGSYLGTVDWHQFGAPGSGWETYGTDLATYSIASGYSAPPQITAGGGSLTITGRSAPVLGMPVCKQGRMTGWTCSTVNKIGWQWIGDGSGDFTKPKRWVWSLFADTRIIPGDSGGPWVSGRKAVGVTSSYDWYSDGKPYATAALLTSLDDYRPGAQVKVWLGRAKLPSATYSDGYTARARWSQGQTVSGTLTTLAGDSISAGTVMDVFVDGTRVASSPVSGKGTFSFTYPGSDNSSHEVTLRARSGYSRGSTVTVTDQPAGVVPKLIRLQGEDRYATAARIAEATWPNGATTVYVASGENFPDALSGGALAGSVGAPILLTKASSIPGATQDAITSLSPDRIVILGGSRAISSEVQRELGGFGASVSRIQGADRYEVAALAASGYSSADTVYIASGESFPDALSAAPRAGLTKMPLMLTKQASLSSATAAQLERLSPRRIVLLGGTEAISSTVESQLKQYSSNIVRINGANRYEVSARIGRLYDEPSPVVWLARGDQFADALAAAPAAALNGAPVVITRPDSLSSVSDSVIRFLQPPRITLVGGRQTLSTSVEEELRWLTFR